VEAGKYGGVGEKLSIFSNRFYEGRQLLFTPSYFLHTSLYFLPARP